MTVSGVALGLLWLWLAPRVPLISDSTAVFLSDSEGEEAIGADGTFVLLALAFGAVSAALVFWFQRRGGIALVVGLALGGLLGSLLAWRLGVWLGPTQDVVAHARAVGKGVVFDAPLQLRAKGALLAWPLGAMAVHLGLTAMFGPRDPEPEWGCFRVLRALRALRALRVRRVPRRRRRSRRCAGAGGWAAARARPLPAPSRNRGSAPDPGPRPPDGLEWARVG